MLVIVPILLYLQWICNSIKTRSIVFTIALLMFRRFTPFLLQYSGYVFSAPCFQIRSVFFIFGASNTNI